MDIHKKLESIGYRFVGRHKHSAVKVCLWCKNALRGKGVCYKQKFYGISSHRCIQMSPSVFSCTHQCLFCWRPTEITDVKWKGPVDEPEDIMDESIEAHKQLLKGFWASAPNKKMIYEAERPKHVAISLIGEPLMYPKISELIEYVKSRKMTAYVVTNGTFPDVLKNMEEPTQLYITLPAPNEDIYKKTCRPLIRDRWKKINESMSLLKNFSCNTVLRLTLVKNLNFVHSEQYAKIIEKYEPKFVEVKSFMSVGFSRERLPYVAMPLHDEIKEFAKKIAEASGYSIKNEQKESRVVLLSK